jgi:hypothetical protein
MPSSVIFYLSKFPNYARIIPKLIPTFHKTNRAWNHLNKFKSIGAFTFYRLEPLYQVVTINHYFIPYFRFGYFLTRVVNLRVHSAVMSILVTVKVDVLKEDKISRLGCRQR